MRGFLSTNSHSLSIFEDFFFNYWFGTVSICHLCSSAPYRAEEGVIFPGDDITDGCDPSGVGVGNFIPVL